MTIEIFSVAMFGSIIMVSMLRDAVVASLDARDRDLYAASPVDHESELHGFLNACVSVAMGVSFAKLPIV